MSVTEDQLLRVRDLATVLTKSVTAAQLIPTTTNALLMLTAGPDHKYSEVKQLDALVRDLAQQIAELRRELTTTMTDEVVTLLTRNAPHPMPLRPPRIIPVNTWHEAARDMALEFSKVFIDPDNLPRTPPWVRPVLFSDPAPWTCSGNLVGYYSGLLFRLLNYPFVPDTMLSGITTESARAVGWLNAAPLASGQSWIILKILVNSPAPLHCSELAGKPNPDDATGLLPNDEETIGDYLGELIGRGFAARPHGNRKGAVATDAGRKYVAEHKEAAIL